MRTLYGNALSGYAMDAKCDFIYAVENFMDHMPSVHFLGDD